MSKGSKTRRSASRKVLKGKQKAAKRSLYASYAGTGRKSEKKLGRRRSPTVGRGGHLMANCGNVGCQRCSSSAFVLKTKVAGQQKEVNEETPVRVGDKVVMPSGRLGFVKCTCRHDKTCIVQYDDNETQTGWIAMSEVQLVTKEKVS